MAEFARQADRDTEAGRRLDAAWRSIESSNFPCLQVVAGALIDHAYPRRNKPIASSSGQEIGGTALRDELSLLRDQLTRSIMDEERREKEADELTGAAWLFINQNEPDANRRASLWTVGRRFIDEPCDSLDPRQSAAQMYCYLRTMCADREP